MVEHLNILQTLYNEGGIVRFYRDYLALLQNHLDLVTQQ